MDNNLKRELINSGITLKKKYGQNFLSDSALLEEIVEKAGVTENDTVLEIGCGAGALTRALGKKAKRVLGYEIDTSLKPVLDRNLKDCPNVEIVYQDVMKESVKSIEKKLSGNYVLVANLPYYITTPIVMRFIENAENMTSMSIMVQEEVADRFSSKSGTSDYGAITVGINLRGSAETVLKVPREMFTPVPNVDSAVVKITIEKNKFNGVDMEKVRSVVRVAFRSRRKMLVNNLMNGYKLSRAVAEKVLNTAGLPLTVRGESLSAEQFVTLSYALYAQVK